MTTRGRSALVALVEIDPALDPQDQAELLARAYSASTRGPVVLILNSLTPLAADRMLDHIVLAMGPVAGGLRYVEVASYETLKQVGPQTVVIAATEPLRRALNQQGIVCTDVESGYGLLDPQPVRAPALI